ncbi:hypothetical protein P3G55_08040 [Leptospira sp. 96542]|nr:hypothetical protein [Leptospira sp. 96542]
MDPQLISFLLTLGNPTEAACQRFILSEGNCVAAPDSGVSVCPGLISNLKSKILPADKSSDSVAILYFDCFTNANFLYNVAKNCGKSSFNTTADYRRAQRTQGGSAETTWLTAFNQCARLNGGTPPPESGLTETGTNLSSDPF